MYQPISVVLVEDNRDIRQGLRLIIDGTKDFLCLGAYPDAETALPQIIQRKPDVVLMDIVLPGASGIECVKSIKEKAPDIDIIMLTVRSDDDSVFSIFAGRSLWIFDQKYASKSFVRSHQRGSKWRCAHEFKRGKNGRWFLQCLPQSFTQPYESRARSLGPTLQRQKLQDDCRCTLCESRYGALSHQKHLQKIAGQFQIGGSN